MSTDKDNFDIATQVVHSGEKDKIPTGQPTTTPIYASATYTYESMDDIDKVFAGEKPGYIYTRYGNPTVAALEDVIRTVEGGATACAYSSGMAALHAALFACELTPGATVLASQDLYGATTNLLLNIFGAFGIKTVTADFSNLEEVRTKAREAKPRVLLAETISCNQRNGASLTFVHGARDVFATGRTATRGASRTTPIFWVVADRDGLGRPTAPGAGCRGPRCPRGAAR